VQRRQDLRDLLSDLSGLPDEQRAALVLAELGAVSHDEIATVLDVPREKVKALVFQARTSLLASRKARDTPCEEIREQIANLSGGSLRRTTLRRHLRECPGCTAFRQEVAMQRRALAVALPVIPTLGLKHSALAAAFGSGSAGGGAVAAAGAGAGIVASTAVSGGGALAAKALVAVALVGGGTAAGVSATRDSKPATPAPSKSAAPGTPDRGGAAPVIVPAAAGVRSRDGGGPKAEDQGNMAHGKKTRTRTRAGQERAERAHGRAGAPGQTRVERARTEKEKAARVRQNGNGNGNSNGAGGGSANSERAKARTKANDPNRGRTRNNATTPAPSLPRARNPVPAPVTPKPRPARPVTPAPAPAMPPTAADPFATPAAPGTTGTAKKPK
jgi:hypothetical protein